MFAKTVYWKLDIRSLVLNREAVVNWFNAIRRSVWTELLKMTDMTKCEHFQGSCLWRQLCILMLKLQIHRLHIYANYHFQTYLRATNKHHLIRPWHLLPLCSCVWNCLVSIRLLIGFQGDTNEDFTWEGVHRDLFKGSYFLQSRLLCTCAKLTQDRLSWEI